MAAALPLFPAIEQRPRDHAASPTSPCSDSLTSEKPSGPLTRVWEPPPRPKPGRKPATDTPPSKRKAQNRQAQRNFRERKAQKISELEDVMNLTKRQHESEVDQLKSQLSHYKMLLSDVETRRSQIEDELRLEKNARLLAEQQVRRVEELLLDQKGAVPLRPRAKAKSSANDSHHPAGLATDISLSAAPSSATCGSKCKPRSCACVDSMIVHASDESTENIPATAGAKSTKNPDSKQRDQGQSDNQPDMEMEIDMTTRSRAPRPNLPNALTESAGPLATSGPSIDNCGFCENSSVCPCREMQEAIEQKSLALENSRPQMLGSKPSAGGGCSGNPGSCTQCQTDPMSREFCVSFAENIKPQDDRSRDAQDGCGAANCCQTQRPNNHSRSVGDIYRLGGNSGGSSMDCATAFNRLKSHPHFDEAMANKEEWMRRLRPIPLPCTAPTSNPVLPTLNNNSVPTQLEGRSAYEIDAASVMATFRHFDTRFGTDSRGDWKKED